MAHLAKWQGIAALVVQVLAINVLFWFGTLGIFFHRTIYENGTSTVEQMPYFQNAELSYVISRDRNDLLPINSDLIGFYPNVRLNDGSTTIMYFFQQMLGALLVSYSCGAGLLLLPLICDCFASLNVRRTASSTGGKITRTLSLHCLRISAVLTSLLAFSMIVTVLLKSMSSGSHSDTHNRTLNSHSAELNRSEGVDLSILYILLLSIGMTILSLSSICLMVTFWPVPYRSVRSRANNEAHHGTANAAMCPESTVTILAAAAFPSLIHSEEQDPLLDPLLTENDGDYQLMEDGVPNMVPNNTNESQPTVNNEVDEDGAIPLSAVSPIESSTPPTKSATRRLLQLAAPEALYLYIGCAVLLCRLPFSLAIPHFVSTTLAALVSLDFHGAHSEIRLLLVAGTIDAVLDFWAFFLFGYANQRIVRGLRVGLFRRLLGQEVAFFDSHSSGELASRLNSDCSEMAGDLTWFFRFSIESMVRITGITAYMLVRCPILGACAISIIPAVACINKLYGDWLRENAIKVQDALADANEVAQEALANVRTVISFVAESQECQRYEDRIEHQYQLNIKQLFMTSLYFMVVSTFLINTVVQGSLLWVGSILVERKMVSAGVLFAFMLYQYQLQNEVLSLLNSFTSLIKSSGAGDKVFVLIDREPPPPSTGNRMAGRSSPVSHFSEPADIGTICSNEMTVPLEDSTAGFTLLEPRNVDLTAMEGTVPSVVPPKRQKRQYHVRFENVSFAYPSRSQNTILDGLNLEIPEGQTVALVGASGCGKTTIVNLLQRFYDPCTGRILVNGMDLRSLDVQMHRRHIGAVTQEPTLFRGSLRENITYGCVVSEEVHSEHVVRAAQLAHADGFIRTFPDQYETAVGERGVQLSGGQKQRIAIARALILQPSLLLLDEATSSLDTESEIAVQQALDELLLHSNNQITTVVIAHRLRTVQNAHKIVVLQNGRVVEEGTHHELLLQPTGVYRRMVERAGYTGVLLDS